jgi:ATP-dependent RNA helicase DHX8/PRP22
MASSHIFAR